MPGRRRFSLHKEFVPVVEAVQALAHKEGRRPSPSPSHEPHGPFALELIAFNLVEARRGDDLPVGRQRRRRVGVEGRNTEDPPRAPLAAGITTLPNRSFRLTAPPPRASSPRPLSRRSSCSLAAVQCPSTFPSIFSPLHGAAVRADSVNKADAICRRQAPKVRAEHSASTPHGPGSRMFHSPRAPSSAPLRPDLLAGSPTGCSTPCSKALTAHLLVVSSAQ